MKSPYKQAEIIYIIEESPSVRRFIFRMLGDELFQFKPGQFVMLDLPIPSKITNRSYSISSAPNTDNIFELIIVLNPNGIGTPYIWANYKVGDIVPVAGPLGKFTLPENIESNLCLIATGTGVAPFRSMIFHVLQKNIPHKHIWLLFGNRTVEDILYQKELTELSETIKSFTFIPTLSRADEKWDGRRGYVHSIYEEIFSNKPDSVFYLCGWKQMILEARERIQNMGFDKKQIKFELYD
ncbi:MAG: FAD-dependent oxidoreductase [Bacteroidia bacterium]|nr:FAD-dependent oxidoreductase [Bacteroidia bacterium]MCC7533641.1 FAD-dependent oxidoreductase [Bacteroidia bacterium]